MCGITAIFGNHKNKEEYVKTSLNKILHRGTAVLEYKIFDKGALGANRLPIVDREHGQQPLSNENDTIFAVQNGEIFNYSELKILLESKGHKFKTDCDTEVLVHLYEEYGTEMVKHLDSEMYAFIIFDKKKDNFFVARDRFGVKPLYYATYKNDYYFGSELKQLAQFEFITEIKLFPKGNYMFNGKLSPYYELRYSNDITNLELAKRKLTELIVDAVKKRVNTDLPIAVLLSGGVDSSLIMEIATRYHKDVTAFILGKPGSSDYDVAVQLCKDNNYKYQIIYPDVDYGKEFEKLIYHLESYEAQVIRQSFALDILSKAVVRAGYRIALVGEASDEIFAGYNEFSRLEYQDINKGCFMITNDLERSHNMRVDRMSMKHTLETRAPFFDTKVVEFSMKIDGRLKIDRVNHQITTKYILRKIAQDFLPEYVAWRYKVPFANGAGMNVGFNFKSQDGDVAKAILANNKPINKNNAIEKYGFVTDEELIYFNKYSDFQYIKLFHNEQRIITKETLTKIDENSKKTRFLVAEFGRLPLYFPVYLASRMNIYNKHNLNVDFIASGGDDLTYNSLLSGSAQIGIADPIFTFTENFNTKGKIIGQLIGRVPIVAVTLNPNIIIKDIVDFNNYKVGTFQEFSTTHALIKELLPKTDLIPIKFDAISQALKDRKIDIGIMTPDFAYDLVGKGGHIVYTFDNKFGDYLFTGIIICDNLDPQFQSALRPFLASVKESINFIKKNKKEALEQFKKEFPDLLNHDEMFNYIINYWNRKLTISDTALKRAKHTWKTVYPWLLQSASPQFIKPRPEDEIINYLSNRNISRDIPYKVDELAERLSACSKKKKSLLFIGFWGASDKRNTDTEDNNAITKLKEIKSKIQHMHKYRADFLFILGNQHAKLNRFPQKNYSIYLKQIEKLLQNNSFKTIYLSELWSKYGLTENKINTEAKKISNKTWQDLRNHRDLEKSAKNKGHKDYKFSAKRYYVCRKLESEIIKKEYPDCIFHSYSEDINQNLFPDCPTLYLWVKDRGYTQVPWFK